MFNLASTNDSYKARGSMRKFVVREINFVARDFIRLAFSGSAIWTAPFCFDTDNGSEVQGGETESTKSNGIVIKTA